MAIDFSKGSKDFTESERKAYNKGMSKTEYGKAKAKKHSMAKKIVGMKDIHGGKKDANRDADSFARTKPVAK